MERRISKFERRIILAILLCAFVPFAISVVFIPSIIEGRLALGMHPRVSKQLEDSAVFFKDFFDAKKREYAARATAIALDPALVAAAQAEQQAEVEKRASEIISENAEIGRIEIFRPGGELFASIEGPPDRQSDEYIPKSWTRPLGPEPGAGALQGAQGTSATKANERHVEITFLLPKRYMEQRAKAEEIAQLYATSLAIESRRSREFYLAYVAIAAAVLILALTGSYFLARKDTRRIARLALATERVAKGETGFTVPLRGNDEITELSRRFNRMIEEVAEARDRIVYLEKVSGWQEFARRLAHEIKNPLTPIRLAIQELRQRAPEGDPSFRKLVEDASDVVEEEIGALTRLVDEFSQFARLPQVVLTPVEFRRFLRDFLSAYNGFEPDAAVDLHLPDEWIVVSLDRILLRRVLFNLITNAIQAAGAGRARIVLRCRRLPVAHMVEVRVEDNGPGIPASDTDRIFDPYFTTKPEGTGLGLAIVKKIVLQHGGNISLLSGGEGASFVILLPEFQTNNPAEFDFPSTSDVAHQETSANATPNAASNIASNAASSIAPGIASNTSANGAETTSTSTEEAPRGHDSATPGDTTPPLARSSGGRQE